MEHAGLSIVKGLPPVPGDTFSAEPAMEVINLLNARGGITLQAKGWVPAIAQLKNGGLFADSPVLPSGQLVASAEDRVTETMRIQVSGSGYEGRDYNLTRLARFAQFAEDFHTTDYQTEPVYIKWQPVNAKGYQYALIFTIQLAKTDDALDAKIPDGMALVIVREPLWRWEVPPGGNPKQWSYYSRNDIANYTLANASLVSGTGNLIDTTCQNKHEWADATEGNQSSTLSKNYIDIAASLVPGDAPALVQLTINNTASDSPKTLLVARSTRDPSGVDHTGTSRKNAYIFNCGDGNAASGAKIDHGTVVTPNGVLSNGSNTNYFSWRRTFASGDTTWSDLVSWNQGSTGNLLALDKHLMRGRYACFIRGGVASGVNGDIRLRLVIQEEENSSAQYSNAVTLPEQNALYGTTFWLLNYLGVVTIPNYSRSVQSLKGYGTQIRESSSNLVITLQGKNTSGASRQLELVDLILMPIDHELIIADTKSFDTDTNGRIIIDNTGYAMRGDQKGAVLGYITDSISGGVFIEHSGQFITLTPNVAQRLYFLGALAPDDRFLPTDTFNISLNIVPRSYGARNS